MAKKNNEPKTIEQIERMKGQTSWGRLIIEQSRERKQAEAKKQTPK